MSSHSALHTPPPSQRTGPLARLGGRLRQLVCGLHGHDTLLHFEADRVSLRCTSCAYESPGWEVSAAAPRPTQPSASAPAAAPSRVVRMPLVGERRVA